MFGWSTSWEEVLQFIDAGAASRMPPTHLVPPLQMKCAKCTSVTKQSTQNNSIIIGKEIMTSSGASNDDDNVLGLDDNVKEEVYASIGMNTSDKKCHINVKCWKQLNHHKKLPISRFEIMKNTAGNVTRLYISQLKV